MISAHRKNNLTDKIFDERYDEVHLGLRNLRVKYRNKIIMGHINIISISLRFDVLSSLLAGRIDIPILVEYKQIVYSLQSSFQTMGTPLFI